jgi:hypothetical protein
MEDFLFGYFSYNKTILKTVIYYWYMLSLNTLKSSAGCITAISTLSSTYYKDAYHVSVQAFNH